MWLIRLVLSEMELSHGLHNHSFSTMWVLWCSIAHFQYECLATMAAMIWFSPVCVFRWQILLLWEKVLSHWLHWYGLPPVCVIWWLIIIVFCEKALSHWLHWYVFSPVWVMWWCVICYFSLKAISYLLQWYGFFSVWSHMVYEISIMWESLFTITALILLLPSVCLHKVYKITSVRKPCYIGYMDVDSPQSEFCNVLIL